MGRGRQKAKQQKIARKLKYLTTDTDYDELAKELSAQEPGTGSVDPFSHEEVQYVHDADDGPMTGMRTRTPRTPQTRWMMIWTSTPSGPPKPPRRRPAARCPR